LGHLTRKKPVPGMTYNVSGRMLNLTEQNKQKLTEVIGLEPAYPSADL